MAPRVYASHSLYYMAPTELRVCVCVCVCVCVSIDWFGIIAVLGRRYEYCQAAYHAIDSQETHACL
jgi:hypothetical protein